MSSLALKSPEHRERLGLKGPRAAEWLSAGCAERASPSCSTFLSETFARLNTERLPRRPARGPIRYSVAMMYPVIAWGLTLSIRGRRKRIRPINPRKSSWFQFCATMKRHSAATLCLWHTAAARATSSFR